MAEKENKDDNKKSEKKFQFNLKKMVLIPLQKLQKKYSTTTMQKKIA